MDLPIALVGLVAGGVHVLAGPDHLAAVAPLAVNSRGEEHEAPEGARGAGLAGLNWGLGHSVGVAGVGLLALLLRDRLPLEALSYWSERAVGFVLIGMGVWVFLQLAGRARRVSSDPTRHPHAALSIGVLHGFAGSSHLLGVLPALDRPAPTRLTFFANPAGATAIDGSPAMDASPAGVALRNGRAFLFVSDP